MTSWRSDRNRGATGATVERSWLAGPDPLFALIGLFLLIIGAIAMARGDFSSNYDRPIESVLGWSHTPLLAWLEIGAGVVLIVAAALRGLGGRALALLVGALTIVLGVLGIADNTGIEDELAIETTHAWVLLIVGAAVVVLALMPSVRTRRRVERRVDRPVTNL